MRRLNRNYFPLLFAGFIVLLSFYSCRPEDKLDRLILPDDWNPVFAAKVLDIEYSVSDLLELADLDSTFVEGQNNVLSIVFSDTLGSFTVDSIVDVPDIPLAAIDTTNEITVPFPGGEKIGMIHMTSCSLTIDVQGLDPEDVNVTVSLPWIRKDGIPLEVSGTLVYTGTIPVLLNLNQDLSGYTMDLSKDRTTYNSLELNYSARKVSDNSLGQIGLLTGWLQGINFSYIDGYFGKLELATVSDTMPFEGLGDELFGDATITLADPSFTINITNNIGVPILMEFPVFFGKNETETVTLSGDLIDNGVIVASPTLSQVGQTIPTTIVIDNSVSNIPDLLNILPTELGFEIGAIANNDEDSTVINFFTDSSKVSADYAVEIPFDLAIEELIFTDTISNFPYDMLEMFSELTVKLVTDNGLPANLDVQMFFADSTQTGYIDSLFTEPGPLLPASPFDASGLSTGSTNNESLVTLTPDRLENIKTGNIVIIRAKLFTPNNGTQAVKIQTINSLRIQLGIVAGIKVSEISLSNDEE